MTEPTTELRIVSASREVAASPEQIFELIADPAQQPRWDGNDNLAHAAPGQRVRRVGDVFVMTIIATADRSYADRENEVVEFEEGRRIAWRPSPVGEPQPGHLWRWELEPLDDGRTLVTHTYDWTNLTDTTRHRRARLNTAEALGASVDRLAGLAENTGLAEADLLSRRRQRGELVVGQRDARGGDVLLQVGDARRAGDRQHDR